MKKNKKYHQVYGPKKYPLETMVKVTGQRNAKSGQEGIVKGYFGNLLIVKFNDGIFQIPCKNIKILSLGPILEENKVDTIDKRTKKESMSKAIRDAYKRMEVKDPRFASLSERNRMR